MPTTIAPISNQLPGIPEIEDMMLHTDGYAFSLDLEESVTKNHPTLPINRWAYQQSMYSKYWNHYLGKVFNEENMNMTNEDGDPTLLFPLQVNIFKYIALRHAYVLWGEAQDGVDPYAKIKCDPKPNPRLQFEKRKQKIEQQKKLLEMRGKNADSSQEENGSSPGEKYRIDAKALEQTEAEIQEEQNRVTAMEAEFFVNTILIDNNMRSKQLEAGIINQYLGGSVFKAYYDPFEQEEEDWEFPIGIELVLPDFFLPVWKTSNPFTLLEAFIVYRYPVREAMHLFPEMEFDQNSTGVIYVEHWTRDTVKITLDDKILKRKINKKDGTQQEIVYDGKPGSNIFGVVPFVYIPHQRTGNFYGDSHIDETIGMVREYNARIADVGDAIGDSINPEYFASNIASNSLTELDLRNGRKAVNLGMQAPGTSNPPEIKREDPPRLDSSLVNHHNNLYGTAFEMSHIPPVARGVDEGSQRSGLTLELRMWPLTSHIKAERTQWSMGMRKLAQIILKMAKALKVGGISDSHLKDIIINVAWEAMIPRDREQQVNEYMLLMSQDAMHPETALEELKIVRDPAAEIEKVLQHIKRKNDMLNPSNEGGQINDKKVDDNAAIKNTGGGVVKNPSPGKSVEESKE